MTKRDISPSDFQEYRSSVALTKKQRKKKACRKHFASYVNSLMCYQLSTNCERIGSSTTALIVEIYEWIFHANRDTPRDNVSSGNTKMKRIRTVFHRDKGRHSHRGISYLLIIMKFIREENLITGGELNEKEI